MTHYYVPVDKYLVTMLIEHDDDIKIPHKIFDPNKAKYEITCGLVMKITSISNDEIIDYIGPFHDDVNVYRKFETIKYSVGKAKACFRDIDVAKHYQMINQYSLFRYTGELHEYYASGILHFKIEFKNGKKHGLFHEYIENPIHIEKYSGTYENDVKHGKFTIYNRKKGMTTHEVYEKDKLQSQKYYTKSYIGQKTVNGNRTEIVEYYNESIGQLKLRCHMIDNQFDGEYIEYYLNGYVKKSCTYVDCKLEGEYIERFSNNKIKIQCNYENGLKHGPFMKTSSIWWYRKKTKANYNHGKLHGRYVVKNADNRVLQNYIYDNGKIVNHARRRKVYPDDAYNDIYSELETDEEELSD